MRPSVVVIEHDHATAAALVERLRVEGFRVRLTSSPQHAGALTDAAVDGVDVTRSAEPVRVAGLHIDTAARAVALHGRPLRLRRLEYELLLVLAREPGRVFAERELLRVVWGCHTAIATRTVASHASRVRRKLAAAEHEAGVAGGGPWMVNVHGVGYRLR